jgi:hypothetical protein
MHDRSSMIPIAFAATLLMPIAGAKAQDLSKYADWSGQWVRADPIGMFDPSKPRGKGQQAPLTPEYQALFEWNLADQASGGHGTDPTFTCIPDGMPRAMNAIFPIEIAILPNVTYMLIEYLTQQRRIFTDGRDWPKDDVVDPTYMGYSIGKWSEPDAKGRFQVLEVETRNFKGPRAFEPSGIPLHRDNQTVVKERFYIDSADPDILHDEITTIDNALTRPWTVNKKYKRERNPIFTEAVCPEGNPHVQIGQENYMLSADRLLMPAKKDQAPPDLRYFKKK